MKTRIGMAAGMAAAIAWAAPALGEGPRAERAGRSPAEQQAPGGQQGARGQQLHGDLRKAMQELHAANQAEIRLGQTAEQRAQSQQVKAFARKMVEQHRQNDQQLQQAAQKAGVTLQGEEYQSAIDDSREKSKELQEKSGAEFDRAYMDHMAKDHEKDLEKVHDAAMKAGEERRTDLAQVFGRTEATLHEHHAMAQEIRRQLQGQPQQERGSMGSQGQGATGAQGSTGSQDSGEQQGSTGSEARDAMGTPGSEKDPGGEPPKPAP